MWRPTARVACDQHGAAAMPAVPADAPVYRSGARPRRLRRRASGNRPCAEVPGAPFVGAYTRRAAACQKRRHSERRGLRNPGSVALIEAAAARVQSGRRPGAAAWLSSSSRTRPRPRHTLTNRPAGAATPSQYRRCVCADAPGPPPGRHLRRVDRRRQHHWRHTGSVCSGIERGWGARSAGAHRCASRNRRGDVFRTYQSPPRVCTS